MGFFSSLSFFCGKEKKGKLQNNKTVNSKPFSFHLLIISLTIIVVWFLFTLLWVTTVVINKRTLSPNQSIKNGKEIKTLKAKTTNKTFGITPKIIIPNQNKSWFVSNQRSLSNCSDPISSVFEAFLFSIEIQSLTRISNKTINRHNVIEKLLLACQLFVVLLLQVFVVLWIVKSLLRGSNCISSLSSQNKSLLSSNVANSNTMLCFGKTFNIENYKKSNNKNETVLKFKVFKKHLCGHHNINFHRKSQEEEEEEENGCHGCMGNQRDEEDVMVVESIKALWRWREEPKIRLSSVKTIKKKKKKKRRGSNEDDDDDYEDEEHLDFKITSNEEVLLKEEKNQPPALILNLSSFLNNEKYYFLPFSSYLVHKINSKSPLKKFREKLIKNQTCGYRIELITKGFINNLANSFSYTYTYDELDLEDEDHDEELNMKNNNKTSSYEEIQSGKKHYSSAVLSRKLERGGLFTMKTEKF